MRTANPVLNDQIFSDARARLLGEAEPMTIAGTVNRIGILLTLTVAAAAWSWAQSLPSGAHEGAVFQPGPYLLVGALGGFAVAMVTVFKKMWAPYTAPVYAVLEGLFLGGISAGFELTYPGIVTQAIFATFGTMFALLVAYKVGIIKVTEKFRMGVFAATGGIFLVYLGSFIASFFGASIPFIHEGGLFGIGFSVVVVVVASLNLVLDFDFIENGERSRAPKYMEWYAAFGLMVTLIWLYLEMLRLLSKTRSR